MGLRNDSHDSGFQSLAFGGDSDKESRQVKPNDRTLQPEEERKITSASNQNKPITPKLPNLSIVPKVELNKSLGGT